MVQACSHLVLATSNVERMSEFFEHVFECQAHFKNKEFADFVLPSRFRVAFFLPIGKAAQHFKTVRKREGISIGLTVKNVEATYQRVLSCPVMTLHTAGPPKEHPWGEKSFLFIDEDDNRWEVTQSPSQDGLLVNKDLPSS